MVTTLLLIIIYISFISLGIPDSLLGSAWPSMYGPLRAPPHYAGYIFMIAAGGTVISSILSARVIRRFGTGLVTAVSVLMTALALAGFSFSRVFIALCLCAVPLGLGAGSVDAALNNYVALHYRARHMNWLHCFWGIGVSTGPLVMSWCLINYRSWHLGYRIIGVMQLCLAAVLFVSLPLWGKRNAQQTAAHEVPRVSRLLCIPGFPLALGSFFCYCAIETVTGLWGSSFLVMEKRIAPEIAARWIALYYTGITVGRFISGFVTVKLNNYQMIRLGQAVTAAGIAALIVPFGNAALLPGLFLIGLGCAPVYPALIHETPANFGAAFSQAAIGMQMAAAYVGTTFMPPLFGQLAARMDFSVFPFFAGALLLLKIIMVETLRRKV
ncbi:MAG: MFS transporter, partial [Spirochaetaceae bacterium]|nr:MFS transporter [Spirochaetaceae bacterium]